MTAIGVRNLLLVGGLDGDVVDEPFVRIDRLGGVGRADRLERGLEGHAGPRVGAAGRGEGVDDGIDLAEIGFDQIDGLLLDRVGEGVAIDALRVKPGGVRGLLEGDRVVPAGAAGAAFLGRVFEEDAERRRPARRKPARCAKPVRSRWRSRSPARASACPATGPSAHVIDLSCTCAAQPSGWAVMQMNPRILGLMIMAAQMLRDAPRAGRVETARIPVARLVPRLLAWAGAVPNKDEIAEILESIGLLLELKGENLFKTRAYGNAARAVETYPGNIEEMARQGRLREIEGIGSAIGEKIAELVKDGRLDFYEKLRGEFPATLFELFELRGLGAKKIKALYEQLQVTSIAELETACASGAVAKLPGFGEKTAAKISAAIAWPGAACRQPSFRRGGSAGRGAAGAFARPPGGVAIVRGRELPPPQGDGA